MTTITMARGTSREIEIPVRDQDGNPLDLAGGHAKFWVGESVGATGDEVVIQKDDQGGGGIVITNDGPLYTLNVTIQPADTEVVPPRDSYYYEAEVTDAEENVYVVAGDVFQLKPSLIP